MGGGSTQPRGFSGGDVGPPGTKGYIRNAYEVCTLTGLEVPSTTPLFKGIKPMCGTSSSRQAQKVR